MLDFNDPNILSGLAALESDDPGMRDYFEACVEYLIPIYPTTINKVKVGSKKRICGVVDVVSFDSRLKKGEGKSWMELHWNKNIDFHQISQHQKDELVA